MSTDRQRVKRAIQRIAVQAPELRSLLSDAESKGGKPKSAGVGSSSEARGDRVCCDGSVSDDGNPGVEERDPDSGGQSGGLDSTDPAKLDMGEGTLSGVTDCATGEPICFDGSGFIPPDGWDGPSDPPADETWREGFYVTWQVTVLSEERASGAGPSTGSVAGDFESAMLSYCIVDEPPYDSNLSPCTSSGTILSGNAGTGACLPGDTGDNRSYNYSVTCNPCSGQPECDYTEEDPPTLSEWPSGGCTNLAIVNGKIVGSKYDPENSSGAYSAPRDSIDLCSGGDQISLAPAETGLFKTINSTTQSGYLFDSSGKVIAHIDGNEYSDPAI